MLNLEKLYSTDEDLEEKGKWFPLPFAPGIELRIARDGNRNYNRLMAKIIEERGIRDVDKIKFDEMNEILLILQSETILVDWKGVVDVETEKPVKYTPKQGRELMQKSKDLREFVSKQSGLMANYRKTTLEEAEKN